MMDYRDEYTHIVEWIQTNYKKGSKVPEAKALIEGMEMSTEVVLVASPVSPYCRAYRPDPTELLNRYRYLLIDAIQGLSPEGVGEALQKEQWWRFDAAIRRHLLPELTAQAVEYLIDVGWLRE